jgi:hypothetical protein
MSREEYRGFLISDYARDGVAIVAVREPGRMTNAWSQAGTGDQQVGRDWVDERLDGKKSVRNGADFMEALEKMAADYEERIGAIQAELEEARSRIGSGGVEREARLRLQFEDGEEITGAEVNRRFKRMSRVCHPDTGGSAEMFQSLSAAKEVLLKSCR